MSLGVEVTVMGWDLSLRVQSKRALAMNSIWLREDGEDETDASLITKHNLENRPWGVRTQSEFGVSIDPILGINLEDQTIREECDIAIARSRRLLENNLISSRLPKGKPTDSNENLKLECPWFGESTDYSQASANAEDTHSSNGLLYGDEDK
ncbi:reverse transcriptase [Gossypium australe]|uniref:Reverse transcriptase n=1 Tax=Gossypium australe TaxID=47621 RepID=A0A5B6X6J2_9ROSI|nr:reverse transcriptase [Gossypium australe]